MLGQGYMPPRPIPTDHFCLEEPKAREGFKTQPPSGPESGGGAGGARPKSMRLDPVSSQGGTSNQAPVKWAKSRQDAVLSQVERTICLTLPANMPDDAGMYRPNNRPKGHEPVSGTFSPLGRISSVLVPSCTAWRLVRRPGIRL